MAKHRDPSNRYNHSSTSKSHDPKHDIPAEDTVPLRADFDPATGKLIGFSVGRPQGPDNYTER